MSSNTPLQVVAHRNAVSADRQDMEEQQELRSPQQTPFGKGTNTSTLPNGPKKNKHKSRSRRRRSSWFDAGTVDLYGERKALVNAQENLWRHIFEVEGIQPIRRLGCNRCGKYFVLFLPILALGLLMWGASITAFTFNIQGVAGFFQEFGHEGSSTTHYSMLDVTRRLLVQASKTTPASSFGIHFIAVLYVSFAFIVPCLQFTALIVMWVVPLTLSRMKRLFFGLEVRVFFYGATNGFGLFSPLLLLLNPLTQPLLVFLNNLICKTSFMKQQQQQQHFSRSFRVGARQKSSSLRQSSP
jgi:hypothetical protein